MRSHAESNYEADLGKRVVQTRDQLGECLSNPHLSRPEYEQRVSDFINAFQNNFAYKRDSHLQGNTIDEDVSMMFASYSGLATAISAQIFYMTGQIGSSFDVSERVKQYHEDEGAVKLKALGFSAVQRAVTLTLLDTIDDVLPRATAQKWDSK